MTTPTVVIVNPQSGGGRTARRVPVLQQLLNAHLRNHVLEATSTPGHARRLAAQHAREGTRTIVVAGGDGTVQEVVGGVLEAGAGDRVDIGILPMGTGCDFARALGLPRALEPAVALLVDGERRSIDVGRYACRGEAGLSAGYFVNVASWGLSGWAVGQLQGRSHRRHASYLTAAVAGIFRVRPETVRIAIDDVVVHDGALTLAAAGNGSSFGGGLVIAPAAVVDDGCLDVVIAPGMGRLALIDMVVKLGRRRHLGRRGVHCVRGRRIEATGPTTVCVEADGELVGTLPLTIDTLPAAITVTGLPR